MTKDRLQQLQAAYKENTEDDEEEEVTITVEVKEDEKMEPFFREVEGIWKEIEEIEEKVNLVHKKQTAFVTDPTLDEKLKQEVSEFMDEIKYKAEGVRKRLKLMEHAILEDPNNMSADGRIRRVQHSTLARKILELMTKYNAIQVEHREKCKERIQRQLEITGANFSDDQIEDMLETGNTSVFTQSITTEQEIARQTVNEVKARHADIIKLEKSIRELHDMFLDMARLVEEQGNMIDRIENHVTNTKDYVEDAKTITKKALQHQRSGRKIKCYILIAVLVLLGVITLIVVLTQVL